MDENGKWSLVIKQDIFKTSPPTNTTQPLPDIVKVEYFFDNDPGFGLGINVPINPDSVINKSFIAVLSLIDVGFHKLYVRVMDENGKWSLIQKKDIFKTAAQTSTPETFSDIVEIEYFFDNDPGFGMAENVPITSDSVIDENFNADLSLVDVGFHKLYVRVMDENNKWSLIQKQDIFKAAAQDNIADTLPDIVEMEYFFDNDPGFGLATNVPITSDSLIDESFNADLSLVNYGFHKLYVRVKDEFEKWSLIQKQDVYKADDDAYTAVPFPDITKMEYFFDNDPGFGLATDVPITSDTVIDKNFNADLSLVDVGFHKLYVRVMDENGKWSLIQKQDVFKAAAQDNIADTLPDIVEMEYFFDNDPGFGLATDVPISSDSLINESFNADISIVDVGFHKLYVRVMDENNKWSLIQKQDIFKVAPQTFPTDTLQDIVEMEYFLDTDPGFGNAIQVNVNPDKVVSIPFVPEVATLDSGMHNINIRVKDENQDWSLIYAYDFLVDPGLNILTAWLSTNSTIICSNQPITIATNSVYTTGTINYNWWAGANLVQQGTDSLLTISITENTTFMVEVIDDIDVDTAWITIEVYSGTVFTSLTSDISCNGLTDGEIDISPTGSGPFLFNWSNGESSEDIDSLESGIYVLTISNENNCASIESFTIAEPDGVSLNENISHISLTGANDGNIQLNLLGGTSPYSYLWSGGNNTDIIDNLSPGYYSVTVTDDNLCNHADSFLIMTHDTQVIELAYYWGMYSTYIIPYNANVINVCSPIVSNIIMVKDGNGSVYWPAFGVNIIGNFVLGAGYQFKMSSADTLLIAGLYKEPELHPIEFPYYWSMIGYLRKAPANVVALLDNIHSDIILFKNGSGAVYWPAFGVNLIGDMVPDDGYQIKMGAARTYTFPSNSTIVSKSGVTPTRLSHYKNITHTDNNMTLGIMHSGLNLSNGDEIGIYNTWGLLVGASVANGNFSAIATWGDDELTSDVDGLLNGEEFEIRVWNHKTDKEYSIVVTEWIENNGYYSNNKIAIAGKSKVIDFDDFMLNQNTPNPFSTQTKFTFYIPNDCFVRFEIFNSLGEKVESLLATNLLKGKHSINFDSDVLTTGTYYYRLKTPKFEQTKKMVIIK